MLANGLTGVAAAIYFAGFYDGEGCFGLRNKHGKQTHCLPRVTLQNTDEKVMVSLRDWLTSIGLAPVFRILELEGNRQTCYSIEVNRIADVRVLCSTLLPFLITKRLQADILIEFISLRESEDSGVDTSTEQDICYQMIREMNTVGRIKTEMKQKSAGYVS